MNINEHLGAIVNSIVESVNQQVQAELAVTITNQVNSILATVDVAAEITKLAGPLIDQKIAEYPVDTARINAELGQIGAQAIENLKTTIAVNVKEQVRAHLEQIDVTPVVDAALDRYLKNMTWPAGSIPHTAVNLRDFTLSGDYIQGGIITDFASTGIDDKATNCVLTILDHAVVAEQPVVTTGLQVKGTARIAGMVSADEVDLESGLAVQLYEATEETLLNKISAQGLVAPKLVFKDKTLIDETQLAPSILNSNLRKVGTLEGLQTKGETLLDNTVYVSQKRVGINTLEPTYALTVWDQDVEVAINKQGQNRAFIGTHRPMAVTLGAAGKEHISLDIDGSVTINDLRLGALPLSTASGEPNWSGRAGEIVFNDSPQIGKPIGWVCLQGHRWARFGTIEE